MPRRPAPIDVLRRRILGALALLPLDRDELLDVLAPDDVVAFDAELDALMAGAHVVRDDADASLLRLPRLGAKG